MNDSISVCGSLRRKPTVSVSNTRCLLGKVKLRVVGIERGEKFVLRHNVRAGQQIQQRRFARVRVTDDRRHRPLVALAPLALHGARLRTASSSRSSRAIRSCTRRRSTSSCVSPGPRVPMPPVWRERCGHILVRRGSRYCNCASSICSRPSRLRARCAKMSRISCVRSRTFREKQLLQVSPLRRRKFVVENHRCHLLILDRFPDQLGFPFADVIMALSAGAVSG